jgi:hypothetical protein
MFAKDMNGDGWADIIGMGDAGTFTALSSQNCANNTRDPRNNCLCKTGYYDNNNIVCGT